MQTAATALMQYAAICSAPQRVSYGQAARGEGRGATGDGRGARGEGRGAALTVVPQLAREATSSVCRGRLNAFLQASDQKVSVVEDIVAEQGSGGP